jgi:hypothetical protein
MVTTAINRLLPVPDSKGLYLKVNRFAGKPRVEFFEPAGPNHQHTRHRGEDPPTPKNTTVAAVAAMLQSKFCGGYEFALELRGAP